MNDVFLSYHSSDRAVAQRVADLIEARGWSVWWDREIPVGKSFDQVIEEQLASARCVVVLWSAEATRSRWVRTEASSAASDNRLVPALIEDVAIPLEFRQIQTALLTAWDGDPGHPELNRLFDAIEAHLARAPSAAAAPAQRAEIAVARPARRGLEKRIVVGAALVLVIGAALTFSPLTRDSAPPESSGAVEPTGVVEAAADRDGAGRDPTSAAVDAAQAADVGRPAAPAPAGAFAIEIGDRVEDGVPAPGAGSIDAANQLDVYTFVAPRGQDVYFRMQAFDPVVYSLEWRLEDERGTRLFETCVGCTEPGVVRLTAGGRYTLTIGSDTDPALGTYRFRTYAVPPAGRFAIAIGAPVREDSPAPGAGAIESPGAEDGYTFTARPRQRVYFRMLAQTGLESTLWRLRDDDDQQIFSTCLACSEPGVQVLRKGGEYRLTVGNPRDPSTGTYALQLLDVPPPNEIEIELPARISRDTPAPGAGLIETPGAEDVYTFTAVAGQAVTVNMREYDPTMYSKTWRLLDDNDAELARACFGCTPPGPQRLARAGDYRLVFGDLKEPSTGAYTVEIGTR